MYFVADTARMGEGFPDLVIANKSGLTAMLFEVKTPETPMKDAEVKFIMQLSPACLPDRDERAAGGRYYVRIGGIR